MRTGAVGVVAGRPVGGRRVLRPVPALMGELTETIRGWTATSLHSITDLLFVFHLLF